MTIEEILAIREQTATASVEDKGARVYSFTPTHLAAFVNQLVDDVCDTIIECDPSPKMILHEPYRSIVSAVDERHKVHSDA